MNNQPAFPQSSIRVTGPIENSLGMTLRDYFAAKAMQGYCSDPEYRNDCDQEDTAISAYSMAEAMLKARES
jgi:hypothetical protein